jgi:hypothetical protein
MSDAQIPVQTKSLMLILAFCIGPLGIHRKLMGYSNWWIMLVTFGGCGMWSMYDFVMLLLGKLKMADGRELT